MRPIDADKLKRKVQRIATEAWMMKLNASVETTLNQFLDYIDQAPTIDIVRCKECTERNDDWCMYWQNVINPDDFCSYGERKEK